MSTLMRIARFSRNERRGLHRAACFSDWLFHLHANVATYERSYAAPYCAHGSFRLSRLEHTQVLHYTRTFEGKEHARFALETRRPFGRMLGAILKIYVHIELMGLISPGKFLRIRPRCVLLRYDLCTERPRSREFFLTTYIIYIRKRAKRTVRRLIINFQSTAWYSSSDDVILNNR